MDQRSGWQTERELRQGYDELASMGDKNYLAITQDGSRTASARTGAIEEADDFARICEKSAAKSWIAAQVLWRGAQSNATRVRGGDVATGGGAGQGGRRSRPSNGPRRHADGWLMDLAEVLMVSEPAAPRLYRSSPTRCGGTRAKEVVPAAARARALLEELAPSVAAAVSVATPRSQ